MAGAWPSAGRSASPRPPRAAVPGARAAPEPRSDESNSGGNDGVGFAISSNTIKSVVSQLIGTGKAEHAYLGVSVQAPANRSGAQVAGLQAGSPAAAAGLRTGDVIVAVDGRAITTADALTSAVSAQRPGDKVTVTYVRNGATRTAGVRLGTRA